MYSVKGQVLNLYHSPATEKYDASWKIQLIGDVHLKDGQVKKDMLTLNVPEKLFREFKDKVGKVITLPVGFFVSNNRLTPFYPKNIQIEA